MFFRWVSLNLDCIFLIQIFLFVNIVHKPCQKKIVENSNIKRKRKFLYLSMYFIIFSSVFYFSTLCLTFLLPLKTFFLSSCKIFFNFSHYSLHFSMDNKTFFQLYKIIVIFVLSICSYIMTIKSSLYYAAKC